MQSMNKRELEHTLFNLRQERLRLKLENTRLMRVIETNCPQQLALFSHFANVRGSSKTA